MAETQQNPTEELELDEHPLSEDDAAALEEEAAKEAASSTKPTIGAGATKQMTCAEMRAVLLQPIPPRLLKTMPGKGGSKPLKYIHWLTVMKFLDLRAPNWQKRITRVENSGLGCTVVCEISIECSDGTIVGSDVGFKTHTTGRDDKPTGFGGAPIVASRQALKRAAADLGLGRGLYE